MKTLYVDRKNPRNITYLFLGFFYKKIYHFSISYNKFSKYMYYCPFSIEVLLMVSIRSNAKRLSLKTSICSARPFCSLKRVISFSEKPKYFIKSTKSHILQNMVALINKCFRNFSSRNDFFPLILRFFLVQILTFFTLMSLILVLTV